MTVEQVTREILRRIIGPAAPQAVTSDLEARASRKFVEGDHGVVSSLNDRNIPAHDPVVSAGVTTMDEYALERNPRQAGSIDEFLWSVTSVGPRSSGVESPITSSRPSSVHLDRRASGTVPLPVTTVTSWGPTGDEWHSIASSRYNGYPWEHHFP